jgi:hypothetical protein
MDESWRREEALKAARSKLAEAEALVEAAEEILRSNNYEAYALDAKEALEYIHGALGG